MKTEVSAGGVVVCKFRNSWQVLVMKDMNDTWTFPKGLIEKNESPKHAAVREVAEEVGLHHLTFARKLSDIEYFYKKNGLIHKSVHYYLFISKSRQPLRCQKEEGIREAGWVAFDKAVLRIGYRKTNVALLEKAHALLTKL